MKEWSLGELGLWEMICQEAMLGCPGLWIKNTWGRRGLPKWRRRPSRVWCGGKLVGSDWPGSPCNAPYKCQARPLKGCLRHPGEQCAHAWLEPEDDPVEWPRGVNARAGSGHHAWPYMSWAGSLRGLVAGWLDRPGGRGAEAWPAWPPEWQRVEQCLELTAVRCGLRGLPKVLGWGSAWLLGVTQSGQKATWNKKDGTAGHWLELGSSWLRAGLG